MLGLFIGNGGCALYLFLVNCFLITISYRSRSKTVRAAGMEPPLILKSSVSRIYCFSIYSDNLSSGPPSTAYEGMRPTYTVFNYQVRLRYSCIHRRRVELLVRVDRSVRLQGQMAKSTRSPPWRWMFVRRFFMYRLSAILIFLTRYSLTLSLTDPTRQAVHNCNPLCGTYVLRTLVSFLICFVR